MYKVDVERCSGCETCIEVCRTEVVSIVDGHAFVESGSCEAECPQSAIYEVA
jgi:NAD-dependent dihydropyrimidine dehydrogenase PreA subunit